MLKKKSERPITHANRNLRAHLKWGLLHTGKDALDFCRFLLLSWPHPSCHRDPEGGRSDTADDFTSRKKKKKTAQQQLQHHSLSSLCSLNDDRRFTCPQHQTHVAFSKTNGMVSSLRWAHLLTLTLVLVFFSTPHLYGKCFVPLFCSVGGFCPFVWKRHQTGPEGHMMPGTWSRWLFFLLLHCHYPELSFFFLSLSMENFIMRQKKTVKDVITFFLLMLTRVHSLVVGSFKRRWRCLVFVSH